MSMELQIFSDRCLGSIVEWRRQIESEKYPLLLSADVRLATIEGFLPAQLRGKAAGFECFHDNAAEAIKLLGVNNFDHQWKFAIGLRWLGSSVDELLASWMAATAYAVATDGIIFDHEEGKTFTPERARATVRNIERDIPILAAAQAELAKRR